MFYNTVKFVAMFMAYYGTEFHNASSITAIKLECTQTFRAVTALFKIQDTTHFHKSCVFFETPSSHSIFRALHQTVLV